MKSAREQKRWPVTEFLHHVLAFVHRMRNKQRSLRRYQKEWCMNYVGGRVFQESDNG